MKNYIYRNKTYTIDNCCNSDIPSHLEKVLSYYNPNEIDIQRQRMEEAVYNGTAYKLVDEDGNTCVFAYYEQKTYQDVNGIALWWNSLRLFAIFGVWFRGCTFNRYIHINPHKSTPVFNFLVEDESIRNFYSEGTSLYIDLYSKKCNKIAKIYESMNVKEV